MNTWCSIVSSLLKGYVLLIRLHITVVGNFRYKNQNGIILSNLKRIQESKTKPDFHKFPRGLLTFSFFRFNTVRLSVFLKQGKSNLK